MRAFEIAVATLTLRVLARRRPPRERRLVPAIDDADAAWLDRETLDRQRAALIASLWPSTQPCVVPALYLSLPAPALFCAPCRITWHAPELEPEHAFPRTEGDVWVSHAMAA